MHIEYNVRHLVRDVSARDLSLRALWHKGAAPEALKIVVDRIEEHPEYFRKWEDVAGQISSWDATLGAWCALSLAKDYLAEFERLAVPAVEPEYYTPLRSLIAVADEVFHGRLSSTVLIEALYSYRRSEHVLTNGRLEHACRPLCDLLVSVMSHITELFMYGHRFHEHNYNVILGLGSLALYEAVNQQQACLRRTEIACDARRRRDQIFTQHIQRARRVLIEACRTFPLEAMHIPCGRHGGSKRDAYYTAP